MQGNDSGYLKQAFHLNGIKVFAALETHLEKQSRILLVLLQNTNLFSRIDAHAMIIQ